MHLGLVHLTLDIKCIPVRLTPNSPEIQNFGMACVHVQEEATAAAASAKASLEAEVAASRVNRLNEGVSPCRKPKF